jgi:very-short-patch-repair endonuclease
VVARRQLLELGFGSRSIEHRIKQGRLHVVARGVYSVGLSDPTRERRWMTAVLSCGADAALSHRSAAALWEIGVEARGSITVSVRRSIGVQRTGLRVYRRRSLQAEEIVRRDLIPVTTPVRTLIDLATELGPTAVERAVNEADKRDLTDPETLRAALEKRAGQPGVPALRRLLDARTFRLSDSDLEILFRPIAAAAGLSPPLTKQWLNGFEVDFYWPELGLVVETDGLRYHRTASTQTRDARRDRAHTLAGLTPLRFTHYEIKHEPRRVRLELSRIADALRGESDIDHT